MTKKFTMDPQEFDELMRRVDRQLVSEGVRIDMRPLTALSKVSVEFGIQMPLGPMPSGSDHPAAENWPTSERIRAWFEHRYGDRLKVRLGAGRMAVLIENDVWIISFPRCYGTIKFIVSRGETPPQLPNSRKPAIYNILNSIEKLPKGLRHSLSDSCLRRLFDDFVLGYDGYRLFRASGGGELIESALGDIAACVANLAGERSNYGLAKWSSLQAAEKMLKARINAAGMDFPKTHNLNLLAAKTREAGLCSPHEQTITKLQCGAGIRYGDEECTVEDAVEAHHAVFELSCQLANKPIPRGN